MTQTIVEVSNLRVVLDNGSAVVEDVNFTLRRGEVLGIVGESGCGKTTTALALLGYAKPGARIASGSVRVCGQELVGRSGAAARKARGRLVSYVPQDATVSLNPSIRIGALISEILTSRNGGKPAMAQIRSALARVHLPDTDEFTRRFPHQLSGGQQQRAILAIALAGDPPVIVLDEPTTGLDVVTQRRILEEIARLRDQTGTAMVYVSHDLAAVGTIADRLAVMYAGRVVEEGMTLRALRQPAHPYTRGLVSSVPDHLSGHRLHGIAGVAVGVGERPAGCAFAPRCTQVVERCRGEMPELVEIGYADKVRCIQWRHTPPLARDELGSGANAVVAGPPLLQVDGLRAVHRSRAGTVTAVQDVSFSIRAGEAIALVGESGSGKTTIARCIVGLHPPAAGHLTLEGAELVAQARRRTRKARRDIQIVFQNPFESINPRRMIREQIARPAQQLRGLSRASALREVEDLLDHVRLPGGVAQRYAPELSGGECQRVAIARALAAQPKLLVCDEITSALDVSVQAAVLELIAELRQTLGLALLFISHDLGVVASVADFALVLERGRVREVGQVGSLMASPADSYTRQLIAAVPRLPTATAISPSVSPGEDGTARHAD